MGRSENVGKGGHKDLKGWDWRGTERELET